MRFSWRATTAVVALAALSAVAACGDSGDERADQRALERVQAPTTSDATTTTQPPTTSTTAPPTTTTSAAPTTTIAATTSTTRPHPKRVVVPQSWVPFATTGAVTLHHPSDHVEAIGFHQSGHDGAQEQTATATAARWFVMEDRGRDTTRRGAADIVVEPNRALRVPVTGTVVRGGSYTLYCDHVDEYVVIAPDAQPGWEVKVLHFEGLAVTKGQHVEAGVTPLATKARVLPFPSQVEDDTGEPAWPHVHVEVVDPNVPDRPTGPGCP